MKIGARTAEMLKRQLHGRTIKSKYEKEFVTFGIVFNGFDIEFYVMAFGVEGTPHYQFYQINTLKIPSSPTSYTNIEESIEIFLSFKTSILSGLAEEADVLKPFIYHNFIRPLQPTVAFINE
ncbi:hypothetical protein EDC94DRAFT_95841 [Helicostylum pulchrum]|nr:hypothetical protein EDC94DRAFT_95841 [Helicostylum pulchrum]